MVNELTSRLSLLTPPMHSHGLSAGDELPDVTCSDSAVEFTLESRDDTVVITESDFTPITVTRESERHAFL